MTVEKLIHKLGQFPPDMQVKALTFVLDDVINVTQAGKDFVQLILGKDKEKWKTTSYLLLQLP